jgi:hypothetical protein
MSGNLDERMANSAWRKCCVECGRRRSSLRKLEGHQKQREDHR